MGLNRLKEFMTEHEEVLMALGLRILTFLVIAITFGVLLSFATAEASDCWRIDYLSKVGPNEKIIAYNDCTGKSATLLVPTEELMKNGKVDEKVLKLMARKIIEVTK